MKRLYVSKDFEVLRLVDTDKPGDYSEVLFLYPDIMAESWHESYQKNSMILRNIKQDERILLDEWED